MATARIPGDERDVRYEPTKLPVPANGDARFLSVIFMKIISEGVNEMESRPVAIVIFFPLFLFFFLSVDLIRMYRSGKVMRI